MDISGRNIPLMEKRMTENKIPSPRDIQKEQIKFLSDERVDRTKSSICFSTTKKAEVYKEDDDRFCKKCNLTFSQTYLNVFWFGFETGVDSALTCDYVRKGNEDE